MERWVGIVLAVLVILVGIFVVMAIRDNLTPLPTVLEGQECRFSGGTCTQLCTGTSLGAMDCPEGQECCEREQDK